MHTFISSAYYDRYKNERNDLESTFSKVLKNKGIRKASLNILRLFRFYLITKETMEGICKGAVTTDRHGKDIGRESINDNSDTFCEHLQKQDVKSEKQLLYFLPKISDVEKENFLSNYTFLVDFVTIGRYNEFCEFFQDPNVPPEEMELSESNSKYCYSVGRRKTVIYENGHAVEDNSQTDDSDEEFEPASSFVDDSFEIPVIENMEQYIMYRDLIKGTDI